MAAPSKRTSWAGTAGLAVFLILSGGGASFLLGEGGTALDLLPDLLRMGSRDPGPQKVPTPEPAEEGWGEKGPVPLSEYFFPLKDRGRKYRYDALEAKEWQGDLYGESIEIMGMEGSPEGATQGSLKVLIHNGTTHQETTFLETYRVYPNKVLLISDQLADKDGKPQGQLVHGRDKVVLRYPFPDGPKVWDQPDQGRVGTARRLAVYFDTCETHKRDYKDCLVVMEAPGKGAPASNILVRRFYARHEGLVRIDHIETDAKGDPVKLIRWLSLERVD